MKVNQMYTEEDFLLKLQKAKFVHSGVFLPSYAMSFVTEKETFFFSFFFFQDMLCFKCVVEQTLASPQKQKRQKRKS